MNPHPPIPELAGKLLLAAPSLRDGTFHKAVILLAEHSAEEGAFGLILNQPTGQTVGDLLKNKDFEALAKVAVHHGGPVSREHLTFAAFWEKDDAFDFAIRISAEEAAAYVRLPGTIVRAFVGYSGWTKDQLEGEMDQESWIARDPDPRLLTEVHDITLWKKLMSSISPFHRLLADAPAEVMAN
ncbi:YqgE/AlgH family protein [Verrucomicrobiaceae bacterium 227]